MTHSDSQRVGGRGQTQTSAEGDTGESEQRDEGVGSVLFTLVFLSPSDAGVCRHAWRLSRCGLQHQDHYRENKTKRETERERVKARNSEGDSKSWTVITLCVTQHIPCHNDIAVFVSKTIGYINKNEAA